MPASLTKRKCSTSLFNYEEPFKPVDVHTNVIEVKVYPMPLINFFEVSQPANMKWFIKNTVTVALYLGKAVEDEKAYALSQ